MVKKELEKTATEIDALWYKDAIIYEVHVRAFFDSDGNGIGDFRGLTEKLDYLQDLGITAIWLLPFYPSPLKDDGYDIADYTDVHPIYGTLQDVRVFVREAHRRGLRVITELVCNHTSDQHPWFQRAREAHPGSAVRNFYVWSDTTEKYKDARIIFKDFEHSNWSWDHVAEAYYWHRFYAHQPDLNFDNPQVRKAIFRVMDFWLRMGIDGLRLDAIPYLYEREGTNCENLPETHVFLKELRRYVDERYENRMFLAEANQWPEDAVAYFGNGDECHMSFHFPLMPRLFMSVYMEDRFPIIDILRQTPEIDASCQWAVFLRNHDELTLEMVTDEERDYMYRVYARDRQARINLGIRRRLAPLLGNHRRKIELMNGLLFSLPGTPVIYYGDEIGMGDNIYLGDRNGVRTPMQWSADRNAGFSRANPQQLYLPINIDPEYHYETVNVEAQRNNPHSLLWWMKRLIALRRRYKAFGRGTIDFLHPENRKVLSFIRRYEGEIILVVANLSRFVQCVELDLAEFLGLMPVEMFGRVDFPPIGELPYFITLGPHSFYWFSLEPQRVPGISTGGTSGDYIIPTLTVQSSWDRIVHSNGYQMLIKLLPQYLQARRWFRSKARRIKMVQIIDTIPIHSGGCAAYILLVNVEYTEGDAEVYVLPLTFVTGDRAEQLLQYLAHTVLARLRIEDAAIEGVLYDPIVDQDFCTILLNAIKTRRRMRAPNGEVTASPTRILSIILNATDAKLEANPIKAEQSNSSVIYGDRLILKLFRKLEPGINPDLEIGRFLTEHGFQHTPPVAGMLEYQRSGTEPATLAILQGFVTNEGDAWKYTLDVSSHYFERALTEYADVEIPSVVVSTRSLLDMSEQEAPPLAHEMIGAYLEAARLLGQRTAEMHLILASDTRNPNFAPEPFTSLYQRSVYQSMRSLSTRVLQVLRKALPDLPESTQEDAQKVVDSESDILQRFGALLDHKILATRIRCHGDYHLGQVLYTGKDFAIIDFEGEPARPLSERRIKRSPMRDVAGMLRSFHYASFAALSQQASGVSLRTEDSAILAPWASYWYFYTSTVFLKAYREQAGTASFIPHERHEFEVLLNVFLLDKSIYELGYELNNRPNWVHIPLQGILQLLASDQH